MKKSVLRLAVIAAGLLALAWSPVAIAQDEASFDEAASKAQEDLDRALKELAELRKSIAGEKLPLTRELSRLETQLSESRSEHEEMNRVLDTRNLDLSNLNTEIEARREERSYLSNLLDEYARNFETRVHISELQRYREVIDNARLAPEKADLSPAKVYEAQVELVESSLDRLIDLVGGATFEGTAVAEDGLLKPADFALIGPIALYSAKDGSSSGMAEQRLGSLEPNMVPFQQLEFNEAARAVVESGAGLLAFDPSMGNARRIEATDETWLEHVKKGGWVMVAILALAGVALLVCLAKLVQLIRVPRPAPERVAKLLEAVRRRDQVTAERRAAPIKGPVGEMLRAGVEHLREPKELIEEVMYEKMLETRFRLQSFLPFIALAAAAAPLLGLLGTVTGMITTFKLITVFGSGDAKTLSSGISEALVTTEYGLITAIPALLLYAFLSRWARRLVDGMEKTAVSFLNRIAPTPDKPEEPVEGALDAAGAPAGVLVESQ
jgi:biopolymer transport protein ExbB